MPGKTRSSSPVQCSRWLSAPSACGDLGRERHGADLARLRRRQLALGVARGRRAGTGRRSHVAPAQRDELAAAQAGERGGEEDRRVLLVVGGAHQRHDLRGREDVERDVARRWMGFSSVAAGLRGSLCTFVARLQMPASTVRIRIFDALDSGRSLPSSARPALQALGREVLEQHVAEGREQVPADDRAVAAQGGGLAVALELQPAQVPRPPRRIARRCAPGRPTPRGAPRRAPRAATPRRCAS